MKSIYVILSALASVACTGGDGVSSVPDPDDHGVVFSVVNAAARPLCDPTRRGWTVYTADTGSVFRCTIAGYVSVACDETAYGNVFYSSVDAMEVVCTRFNGVDRWINYLGAPGHSIGCSLCP